MSTTAPPTQAVAVNAYRVIVTELRTYALVDKPDMRYVGPPQTEQDARALIELIADGSAEGTGPWRRPVAGGQRTIELRVER